MRRGRVCGIGNGLVDILVEVTQEELDWLGLRKGSMELVSLEKQKEYLVALGARKRSLVSGGSLANSMVVYAQLGGIGSFITRLGADEYGIHFRREFSDLGVEVSAIPVEGESSGTCLVFITPDAERTMRTNLGASAFIAPEHVTHEALRSAEWVFLEGYLLGAPGYGDAAAFRAVDLAKQLGCKLALSFSALYIVENFGEALRKLAAQADIIFANREEALAFTGDVDIESACWKLSREVPCAVVTAGGDGSLVVCEGKWEQIGAVPCQPIDLTGAGDVFAGAYLYGITQGLDSKSAARGASYLAKEVICRVGSRLEGDVRKLWLRGVGGVA